MRFIYFFITTILTGLTYLYIRFISTLKVKKATHYLITTGVASIFFLIFYSIYLKRTGVTGLIPDLLGWVSYTSIGYLSFIFTLLIIRDLFLLIHWMGRKAYKIFPTFNGDGKLLIAGVTDIRGGRFIASHRSSPKKAIANAPDTDLKILLAHQPKSVFEASNAGFDIQLAGHTHGGQFFPWNLAVYLDQPYVAGLYKHKNTLLYVSRGTGYWGPPLRLGSPSEITRLKLVAV